MGNLTVEVVTTVATGIAIGALLIVGGVLIGVWISRRLGAQNHSGDMQAQQLLDLIGSLSNWTHGFAGEVSQYENQLRGMIDGNPDGSGRGGSADNHWLRDILASNEHLRLKVQDAERMLAEKAKEVEGYLSEARTDTLTSLPNRRAFDSELGRRFAQWQRYGTPLSVMILDIDHFKKFNDTYGHLAGDYVLQGVAKALTFAVRDSDLLVRLGGEELAVILPSTTIDDAAIAAQRLCTAVRVAKLEFEGNVFQVTVSVGVAQGIEGDNANSLVKRADEAMYAAKQAGRDRAYFHDGVTNQPVGDSKAKLNVASRGGIPPHLEPVCEGLRERLIEITRR